MATKQEWATGAKIGKAATPSKISDLFHLFRLKDYMKKKESNVLGINLTQQRFAKSLQRVS
jgi:hypothetical protein